MLEGLKVVEMATYIAAPGAGGILADWGAEVIKIEPLSGCPMRYTMANVGADHLKGSPIFDLDNRGKKGLAINTATPEGVAAVKRLVEDADVFITNVRPGGLERAGLDYDSLKEINPRLIYASVTGYGLEGPDRDRPGFDIAAFYARSGVGWLQTVKGGEPVSLRTGIGDHTTSMATVGGILAAVFERQTTGKGRLVEASLLRAGIYAAGSDTAVQLRYGKLGSTKTRHEAIQPISNFFKTRDTWIVIVPRQGSTDWTAICKVIGRPELETDPRFDTPKNRRANAAELVDILDAAFIQHDLAHWREKLDAEDMIWAPLLRPADVFADPQARAAGAYVEVPEEGGGEGTYLSPASPIRFPGADDGPKGPAPVLGEHTIDTLKASGFSDEEIEGLRKAGAIG
ncbi:crotonobetainyl-CoA:carnitine CoA-transferase CaiB-like acyl-CoA transferase [Parvibaculum indicum]|uniref:CaiB/BaiF CoA transferase family protein n=1 Tax=Parvibaculum indicum TaxID=562969 RepID=UPI00141EB71E|nr:CaiB/BaiF CoA-transferase family protein [Parvibaculum indicum]NIJ40158.1 crotonobetainyl-CoA:carnitine CoA-transferase CaiB-like acyl-CoA transferase [Parvibaculum indicum]